MCSVEMKSSLYKTMQSSYNRSGNTYITYFLNIRNFIYVASVPVVVAPPAFPVADINTRSTKLLAGLTSC